MSYTLFALLAQWIGRILAPAWHAIVTAAAQNAIEWLLAAMPAM